MIQTSCILDRTTPPHEVTNVRLCSSGEPAIRRLGSPPVGAGALLENLRSLPGFAQTVFQPAAKNLTQIR